ncbi:hypothetical protein AB4Y64_07600 [Lysobacter sp. TAF61]|uniref:hypothetical protein n=1 Tax=Lysobacter sp. TAF61 TaxID=3233072 RepID=UPI003F96F432
MTDIILHDIDPLLLDRIKRVASQSGWGMQESLMHLLEHGLFACEAELAARFTDSDAMALQSAIAALEGIPSDPGYALIGRVERPKDVQTPTLDQQGPTDIDRDLLDFIRKP